MPTSYDAGGGSELRLDGQLLGEVRPWAVSHRGLEYPGEVIVSEKVNPAWGEPLEGDVCFRVVFYTVPRRIPAGQIRDPRIAMVVPRRSADPAQQRLGREIQAIRESKERYVAGPDAASRAMRTSMDEQEGSLLREVARREALSYAQGRVYTHAGPIIQPAEIFADAAAGSWVGILVDAVFPHAYPHVPFDFQVFPEPLTFDVGEAIFRGFFQGHETSVGTASIFGPALGLTQQEAPAVFDPGGSAMLDIIKEELESSGGELSAQDLLIMLGRDHGLNRTLAALYLLSFVRQARAEVELAPNHDVELVMGGPFRSDRISWHLLQEIRFTRSAVNQLGVLRAKPALSWNAILPYAGLLVEGLSLTLDARQIAEQEGRLTDALDEMGRGLEGLRGEMRVMATDLGQEAGGALSALDRLQVLCAAAGFRGFHTVAVDSFGGPSGLAAAVDLYERVEKLAELAPNISRERLYMDEMTFSRGHQELALKRDSIVARMGLDSLIGNPSLWDAVAQGSRQLRREYAAVYRAHHSSYHDEAAELAARLEGLRPQVEALARFNEVDEFGGPLAEDVPDRFFDLMGAVRTCPAIENGISLEDSPICSKCLLPLNEDVPRRHASLVMGDLQRAVSEYNRRLSSEGVRRVRAHPSREQLDKFINLVQVSDLSALANVLDDDVLEFLRRFVRAGGNSGR